MDRESPTRLQTSSQKQAHIFRLISKVSKIKHQGARLSWRSDTEKLPAESLLEQMQHNPSRTQGSLPVAGRL